MEWFLTFYITDLPSLPNTSAISHSVLNSTCAAVTLLFSCPTVNPHTVINGECNYYCIRQGYYYSSLEVKSLNSEQMVFCWPWGKYMQGLTPNDSWKGKAKQPKQPN